MTKINPLDSSTIELYRQHFSAFEKEQLTGQSAWLCPERRAAFERFQLSGFPSLKDEAWRYTSLEKAKKVKPARGQKAAVNPSQLAPYILDASWPRAVFIDGLFQPELSQGLDLSAGMKIMSLAEAVGRKEPGVETALSAEMIKARTLTDLNTALFTDGLYLEMGARTVLTKPLQLLSFYSFSSGEGTVNTRNIVNVQNGAQATLVQTFAGDLNSLFFANDVTEVKLSDKAQLDHYVLQQGSRRGMLTARCEIKLEASSRYRGLVLSSEAHLFRYETAAALCGSGSKVTLSGLYLTKGDELMDQNVLIEHRVPGCASEQLLKGIADGRSRLVMQGKVHVLPDAQKTAAFQTMRNLLLSPSAIVDAKPELEIFADDVKCSHGAAIGQLEDDSLFYLQSRGIGAGDARKILTRAFAMEIIEKIELEAVKRSAESSLNQYSSGE